ncbi:hypothetical protein D1007_21318 [Hordeum vulgare]|nr:hypothetical protein D1007_21318 [Hordeum vulgare]
MVTLSSLLSTMSPVTLNLPPPSPSTPSYRLNNVAADMEAFLCGIMDNNALSDGLMDDEYYLLACEGNLKRLSLLVPVYYSFMM